MSNPAVHVGTPSGGFGKVVPAETRTYTDANNKTETISQHARIEGLQPDTDYVYKIVSDGETHEQRVPHRARGPQRVPLHQRR